MIDNILQYKVRTARTEVEFVFNYLFIFCVQAFKVKKEFLLIIKTQ